MTLAAYPYGEDGFHFQNPGIRSFVENMLSRPVQLICLEIDTIGPLFLFMPHLPGRKIKNCRAIFGSPAFYKTSQRSTFIRLCR